MIISALNLLVVSIIHVNPEKMNVVTNNPIILT